MQSLRHAVAALQKEDNDANQFHKVRKNIWTKNLLLNFYQAHNA